MAYGTNHTHECRDCGNEIPCDDPDVPTCSSWDGGNAGCCECEAIFSIAAFHDILSGVE